MRRALRNIIAGGLFLAVTLFALSRPAVQTWLCGKWIHEWGPEGLEVREVNFDGRHFTLRGVVWRNDHFTITLPTVSGRMRWQDTVRARFDLEHLEASGWYVTFEDDLPSDADLEPGGKIDWSVKVQQLRQSLHQRLPIDIDTIDFQGAIRLPKRGAHREPPVAFMKIKGANLGPGKDARFEIHSIAKDPDVDGQIVDLDATTEVALHMSSKSRLERMVTETRASAVGARFPNGTSLNLRTTLDMTGDDLAFGISASGSGSSDLRELLIIDARTEPGTRTVSGSWRIDLNQGDLRPYSLGFHVPDFSAKGFGLLSNTGGIRIAGELEAYLKDPGQADVRLRGVGPLEFRAVFDFIRHKRGYAIHRLSAKASNEKPVASFQVLQPVELDEAIATLSLGNPEGDLFHLEVENVSSSWIQTYFPGVHFTADEFRGSFLAQLDGKAIQMRTLRPLAARALSLEWKGQRWFERADVNADLQLIFSRQGWALDMSRLDIESSEGKFLHGQAMVGRAPGANREVKLTGSLDLDLPAARNQPFARRAALKAGKAQLKLDLALAKNAWQALAEGSLTDAMDVGNHALPRITTSARIDRSMGGAIDLEMPLQLQAAGRQSLLMVLGSLHPGKERRRADVIIRTQDAHLEDLQVVLAALAKYDLTPGAGENVAPRKSQAAWGQVDSTVRLALNGLVLPGQAARGSIDMLVHGNPDQLVIETMAITLGEKGTAVGKGEINYSARAQVPYHFAALFRAKDFNPAPILASLDPGRAPLIEGQFDVDVTCKGSTEDFSDLAQVTSATISLTGRGGRFHAFDASALVNDFTRQDASSTKFAAWLAAASGSKNDRRIAAATNIIRRLADLNYDQATFELVHRPGEDTFVREFSLIAPELRLVGEGNIVHDMEGDWKDGRVRLTLDMSARGQYAEDIQLLGLSGERADSLGYVPIARKLYVEGTLRDFGTESLTDLISTSMPK